MRHVRDDEQELVQLRLKVSKLFFQRLESVGLSIDLRDQCGCVLAFAFCVTDLFGKLVAPRLQLLRLGLYRFALMLERLERSAVKLIAALGKPLSGAVQVGA